MSHPHDTDCDHLIIKNDNCINVKNITFIISLLQANKNQHVHYIAFFQLADKAAAEIHVMPLTDKNATEVKTMKLLNTDYFT